MKKILIIAGILTTLVLTLSILTIKVKVVCKSQTGVCPESLNNKIQNLNNKKLVTLNRQIKKILANNYLVNEYSIRFKLPNIYIIDLIAREPVFALKDMDTQKIALVSSEGKILAFSNNSYVPIVGVELNSELVEGSNVGEINLFALRLTDGVNKMYQIKSSQIQNNSLLVELRSQIRVLFPLDGEIDVLLGSLRLIYSKVEGDNSLSNYREIDLRYKNPVIR